MLIRTIIFVVFGLFCIVGSGLLSRFAIKWSKRLSNWNISEIGMRICFLIGGIGFLAFALADILNIGK